jgi:hypothetical protein
VPDSADLVMFWWHKAAALVTTGKLKQFGLITTIDLSYIFRLDSIWFWSAAIAHRLLPVTLVIDQEWMPKDDVEEGLCQK